MDPDLFGARKITKANTLLVRCDVEPALKLCNEVLEKDARCHACAHLTRAACFFLLDLPELAAFDAYRTIYGVQLALSHQQGRLADMIRHFASISRLERIRRTPWAVKPTCQIGRGEIEWLQQGLLSVAIEPLKRVQVSENDQKRDGKPIRGEFHDYCDRLSLQAYYWLVVSLRRLGGGALRSVLDVTHQVLFGSIPLLPHESEAFSRVESDVLNRISEQNRLERQTRLDNEQRYRKEELMVGRFRSPTAPKTVRGAQSDCSVSDDEARNFKKRQDSIGAISDECSDEHVTALEPDRYRKSAQSNDALLDGYGMRLSTPFQHILSSRYTRIPNTWYPWDEKVFPDRTTILDRLNRVTTQQRPPLRVTQCDDGSPAGIFRFRAASDIRSGDVFSTPANHHVKGWIPSDDEGIMVCEGCGSELDVHPDALNDAFDRATQASESLAETQAPEDHREDENQSVDKDTMQSQGLQICPRCVEAAWCSPVCRDWAMMSYHSELCGTNIEAAIQSRVLTTRSVGLPEPYRQRITQNVLLRIVCNAKKLSKSLTTMTDYCLLNCSLGASVPMITNSRSIRKRASGLAVPRRLSVLFPDMYDQTNRPHFQAKPEGSNLRAWSYDTHVINPHLMISGLAGGALCLNTEFADGWSINTLLSKIDANVLLSPGPRFEKTLGEDGVRSYQEPRYPRLLSTDELVAEGRSKYGDDFDASHWEPYHWMGSVYPLCSLIQIAKEQEEPNVEMWERDGGLICRLTEGKSLKAGDLLLRTPITKQLAFRRDAYPHDGDEHVEDVTDGFDENDEMHWEDRYFLPDGVQLKPPDEEGEIESMDCTL